MSLSEYRHQSMNTWHQTNTGYLYQSLFKTQLQHSDIMKLAMWLAPVSHILVTPCCNTSVVSLLTELENVFTMAFFVFG